jgi:hypothetical protein
LKYCYLTMQMSILCMKLINDFKAPRISRLILESNIFHLGVIWVLLAEDVVLMHSKYLN